MNSEKTQARFAEMLKMRDERKSITVIAKHFNVSRQRVSQIFHENGQQFREDLKGITDDQMRAIQDPYKIASKYGVDVSYVKARLRRMGIKYPRHVKWTKDKTALMYSDYLNGLTQQQIAVKYHTQQVTVSRLFIKYGFETRRNGWVKNTAKKELA